MVATVLVDGGNFTMTLTDREIFMLGTLCGTALTAMVALLGGWL